MDILIVILASVAATTLMTLFSYVLSDIRQKQFREPVLLHKVIASTNSFDSHKKECVIAWSIHYFIGLLFIIGYHILFDSVFVDPTWFAALVLGMISGAIGILGWRLIFKYAPKVPRISFNEYFVQLLVAHIIFAITAIGIYKIYGV